jgi:toxin-antitoxin system PIN domain toxin
VQVVDTNVLIYAVDPAAPHHDASHRLVERFKRDATPFVLTWGIIFEFLRVSTHPKVLRQPFTPAQSWAFLQSFLKSSNAVILTETIKHGVILQDLLEHASWIRGNLVFDARTVVLMREHGVRTIYTYDRDFRRFSDIEVIEPAP